jgi:hypothetical protein
MTCVVLGGSRHIARVPDLVKVRLERIVKQDFRVVVGDAPGADKALQKYFADCAYRLVEVFFSGDAPRNNLGAWTCHHIGTSARPGTFEFHAAKDRAMAEEATVGLMLWDGESAGTMLNVWRLSRQGKATLVFIEAEQRFVEVRTQPEWSRLLAGASEDSRRDIERKSRAETAARPSTAPLFGPDLGSLGLA